MASTNGNSSENTNEGCESKESSPVFSKVERLIIENAAKVYPQCFGEHYGYWNKFDLPIGYRFKPTDEELMDSYLRVKKFGGGIIYDNIIKDLDIYEYEPSQLKSFAYDNGDKKMYFFSPLHKKYENGKRAKRIAYQGFWKATQKGSPVEDKDKREIGTKTPLAFYSTVPNSKGQKTQWLMQEYRLHEDINTKQTEQNKLLDDYVLCVVYLHKEDNGDESNHDNNQSPMPSMDGSSHKFGEASCSYSGFSTPSYSKFADTPVSEPSHSSTMHTPNLYHSPQQLKPSPSRASFNPNFNMNPSITQDSYLPSNSNFHVSNIAPTINGFETGNFWHNTIQNTGQYYIGIPNQMNHYSNLGTTTNVEHYSYNNPSPLIPLSNIITNMDNSMNPNLANHVVDSNPTTSIPNPNANPSMNYWTHPTINSSGRSPNLNSSADLSMRSAPTLDPH